MGIKEHIYIQLIYTHFQSHKEGEINQSRQEADVCLDSASKDQKSCFL